MKRFIKFVYRQIPLKKQIFSLVKKFYTPSESIYKHLQFHGEFVAWIDKSHSFLMKHYGFELENKLFWAGLENGWEKTSTSLWIELVKKSDVILDIGANTGVYALIAKSLNPPAQVFAFEPIERVFQKLEHNIRLNEFEITLFEYAVSNTEGTATIYDLPTEHIYSVTVNKNLNLPETEAVPTKIKVMRLDTLINQRNIEKIDLIKIDVETHEAEVLEGMGVYLEKFKPTMLIEILNDEVGQNVENLVKGKGYLYFNLDENMDSIRKVDKITKSDFYNYLLCNEQLADQLGLLK